MYDWLILLRWGSLELLQGTFLYVISGRRLVNNNCQENGINEDNYCNGRIGNLIEETLKMAIVRTWFFVWKKSPACLFNLEERQNPTEVDLFGRLKYTWRSVRTLLAFFAFWFISCYSFDIHATRLVAYSITFNIAIYKITKIVRALWLAERSVCMRVCKHGCGVKKFCFSRSNHASTNLKKFSSSKLDKFTLFTHSFVGWNLENRYQERVSIFFFA